MKAFWLMPVIFALAFAFGWTMPSAGTGGPALVAAAAAQEAPPEETKEDMVPPVEDMVPPEEEPEGDAEKKGG